MTASLISGEVNQGVTLHVWNFTAELVEYPNLTKGWTNIQVHEADVPEGTTLVTKSDGFGPVTFARLPDGTLLRAADFADTARKLL